ncbi:MAG: Crp/Fnr family transcriptional regulator [Proteobacteria bacterium]|nr:Crp/Fnr family transcriptional regulator [Pseudomonadota bacterium]MBU4119850.1 Crp/Fnr family transcriptional regulator [Pseudomonadota bacterium]
MKTDLFSIDLIRELQKPEYSGVRAEFTEKSFLRNVLIFPPDDRAGQVFIVKKGRVRVYLAFEDKEFSLAILKKGDIYSTHTRAYVTTLDDTVLLVMPTAKFHRFMILHPVFSRTVMGIFGELLKQSFSIITSLVFKDVTQRLAEFLLYEARSHGRPEDGGVSLTIDLTMEQLAAVVGSSRQTASTLINEMIRAGVLVKRSRRELFLPKLELLKDFSMGEGHDVYAFKDRRKMA